MDRVELALDATIVMVILSYSYYGLFEMHIYRSKFVSIQHIIRWNFVM